MALTICVATAAQAPGTEIARDAKALMLRAAESNSLVSEDIRPWHMRATYKLLDDKGGPAGQGTIEEFWMGPKQFKRILKDATFERIEFGTPNGVLRSGQSARPPVQIFEIEHMLLQPMQETSLVQIEDYDLRTVEAPSGKMDCLSMKDAGGARFGSTWCLSTDKPILRIIATPQSAQILRSSIVEFAGHFVAKDIAFIQEHKTRASVHIDLIEQMQPQDEASLPPTPDASPAQPQELSMGPVIEGFAIKKALPDRSQVGSAKGTVTLIAIIGKDGRLRDIHLKSGPASLEKAATDAAKRWIYRPTLLNNDPVETMTSLNFVF